jgi:hypothetical protein
MDHRASAAAPAGFTFAGRPRLFCGGIGAGAGGAGCANPMTGGGSLRDGRNRLYAQSIRRLGFAIGKIPQYPSMGNLSLAGSSAFADGAPNFDSVDFDVLKPRAVR